MTLKEGNIVEEGWTICSQTITCGALQIVRFLRCIRSERATVLHQIPNKDLGIGWDLRLVGWMS